MPTNKDAFIRFRAINRCLIDHKFATKEQLINYCEEALGIAPLAERTIEKDIEDMRQDSGLGFFAPIEYSRQEKGYYYSKPGYSIDNIPLSSDEMNALNNALGLLNEYRGTGIFNEVEGAIEKLVSKVKLGMSQKQADFVNFVELERAPVETGLKFLKPCIDAIKDQYVLSLEYARFNSTENKTHIVHPCYLKEYRNRWYLIGWHQKHQSFSTFALDRVVNVVVKPHILYETPPFDVREFFNHVIGMSLPMNKPVLIKIRLSTKEIPYVLSQPVHLSQKVIFSGETHADISLFVIINYELISWIYSFGPEVEVLEPAWFRDQIYEGLKKAVETYNS
jgi:predicted DNA-binding transcriptional regulator YafY